jgi:hypothetical protein
MLWFKCSTSFQHRPSLQVSNGEARHQAEHHGGLNYVWLELFAALQAINAFN